MKKNCYIIFLAIGVLGCTKPMQNDLSAVVEANQKATSLLEWESADENPRKLFNRLREEVKTHKDLEKDICGGLLGLSGQNLSLFEGEINKKDNQQLLNSCGEQLKKNLEKYWHEQKKLFESTGLNFHFEPRFEKRDLSKGYRAATGDVQPKELVLTFDDGPDPQNTAQILDILTAVNAKVMFFNVAPQTRQNPFLVYRAAREGHSIGSHSVTHRCLANNDICVKANKGLALTLDDALAEIRGGHQAVFDILGFVDPFFRFPYGESDPTLVKFLAEKQVAQMYWSIDSTDWKAQSNPDLLKTVMDQIDKNQRGIVLFHDTQRRTLEILPEFLKTIYDRGYTLVVLQPLDDSARYNSQLVTKSPIIP